MGRKTYSKTDAELDLKHLDIPYKQRLELIEDSFKLWGRLRGKVRKLEAGINMAQSYERSGEVAYNWIYRGINGPFL
ncbi:hypothetical protein KAR91_60655 [Candidatus Pacearchaeota archaeon]|nr:hypothetical protein [Candidatus Pacearchaeota archaeon]